MQITTMSDRYGSNGVKAGVARITAKTEILPMSIKRDFGGFALFSGTFKDRQVKCGTVLQNAGHLAALDEYRVWTFWKFWKRQEMLRKGLKFCSRLFFYLRHFLCFSYVKLSPLFT